MIENQMYDLLIQLAKIPSVSPGREEKVITQFIYRHLLENPYFKANTGLLELLPIENDPFQRESVFAMVRAVPETPKTIIVMGHLDVVETSEARDLAELAFDPEEYTRQLSRLSLPEDAKGDLESGDFLFGRGVFDMKCGVAAGIELLQKASLDPEALTANLLLLLVCDEENQSAGMVSAVKRLLELKEQQGLDFVACVNTEGETTRYHGDQNKYVSLGTIGKMMPLFYCVGRESHVGSYYEGLNANLLTSAVNMALEGSAKWADSVGSTVYPPPASLKQQDLRDIYSVTLPARAVTYFNYLFAHKTPADVLPMMKKVAYEAFELALECLGLSADEVSGISGEEIAIPWQSRVITYEELLESVKSSGAAGFSQDYLDAFFESLPEGMDDREKSIAIVSEVLRFYTDKEPVIIVGFLPPFYPSRSNLRASTRELGLLRAVSELIGEAKEKYGEVLECVEHFAAISDLSYMGFQGERDSLLPLAANTPGWGAVYSLPLEALLKLDVPVVNLGPVGRDAHKYTERLDLRYYLGAYPVLLESLIKKLSVLD